MTTMNFTRLCQAGSTSGLGRARRAGLTALLFTLPFSASASQALDAEQQAFLQIALDKVQPYFSTQVDVEDHLTVAHQGQWVLISGALRGVDKPIDWQTEASEFECDHNLDKSLWVLMQQDADEWQFEMLHVCATEPLSWHLDDYAAQLPCGILEQILKRPHGLYPDYCPDKAGGRDRAGK
uniref:hypothetical protein n=1 Tax=Thaumasiovibrio occultus TaxID=1891184 RepID=UPI00131D7D84|nr:hypothetical protein [Thaumasiovibrio occultus]